MVENEAAISEEEAAQYDRQIRLWGLEAQKRLRTSRLLLVGLQGLGAEIAKNIILAGVKSVTLLDDSQVSAVNTRAQFLVPHGVAGIGLAEASLQQAQLLNPMVEVKVEHGSVASKPDEFFSQFDAVCLTACILEDLLKICDLCHSKSIKFFAGGAFGYHGYMFADLGLHDFVEEETKKAELLCDGPVHKKRKMDASEMTLVKKTFEFCTLKDALTIDWTTEQRKKALKKTPSDYFVLKVAEPRVPLDKGSLATEREDDSS
uniref:SUMO-activating enzyme subunit 1-like isoform X1 n=1 Tax=Myxine glutinosa TaxID=7769 RepID=UPI00358E6EF8